MRFSFAGIIAGALASACAGEPTRSQTTIAIGERDVGRDATAPLSSLPPDGGEARDGSTLQEQMRAATADAGGTFDRSPGNPFAGVDARSCKTQEGPIGAGHVTLTFAGSGEVTSAVLDAGPFAGTAVGACVIARFRTVRVAPFDGNPVKVGKSFIVD